MKKKIGIMGGSFNPIHFGHLLLAETAYEEYNLDKVLVMPTKSPAYKDINKFISDTDRVNMVKLAIKSNSHLELSDLEFLREGNTYTIDTINILRQSDPDSEYYFIMGADSLFHFESWREPQGILDQVTILVAGRYNKSSEDIDSQIDYLINKYDTGDIKFLNSPHLDISSFSIRKRISDRSSIKYLVPEEVEEYIYNNKLYGVI